MLVACEAEEEPVVHVALDLLNRDCEAVLSQAFSVEEAEGDVYIGTWGKSKLLEGIARKEGINPSEYLGNHPEAFFITVLKDGKLLVAGSDKRGTAYGVLELSRMLGVSPWEWWADVVPDKKQEFRIAAGFTKTDYPLVPYRGIFINDEDWGLMPWSYTNYEPSDVKGQIGPKTHARIFELLLRLRANTFWPAMHECSVPFFFTEGNKEMADKYAIYLGTSHCEPMMRNTNGEWRKVGKGEYNYLTNRENVLSFWEERVKLLRHSDDIYTLGMRGVHDSGMLGAKTVEDQKKALTRIIEDQRKLLAEYKGEVTEVPQVLIPYKEVLDVYEAGLEVPEDVTLMWCDDNYGYITHFPTEEEAPYRRRSCPTGRKRHLLPCLLLGASARLPVAFHCEPLPYLPADEDGIRQGHPQDVDSERGRHQACRIPDRAVHGHGMEYTQGGRGGSNPPFGELPCPRVRRAGICPPAPDDAGALPPCPYPQAGIYGEHPDGGKRPEI